MQFIRLPKGDRHCREGIARTGCGLGGHLECEEHQEYCPPAAPSEYAGLLSYRVVETLNAPSGHHWEFHTSGMSQMRHEQPSRVPDNHRPRQPTEGNIVAGIHLHNPISSQGQ